MKYIEHIQEVLVDQNEIDIICGEMRKKLEEDYQNVEEPVIFLGLLKGCHPFMSDLLSNIEVDHVCDYMDVSSYFGNEKAVSEVKITKDMTMPVKNRDIVIVEDIVDSGRTIKKVIDLLYFRGAKSVKVATCADKPSGRSVDLVPEYAGCIVPNEFLVGYGLDYREKYRNLKFIGILKDDFK